VSEFHAEALQETASEGPTQGAYVADRAGFKPATLWTKGAEFTNAPPCPTIMIENYNYRNILKTD